MIWLKLPDKEIPISVGGGTAGCVLANRLSADPKIKVALIEAGDQETEYHMSDIPLMSAELQKTEADWQYQTESQHYSCGSLINHVLHYVKDIKNSFFHK